MTYWRAILTSLMVWVSTRWRLGRKSLAACVAIWLFMAITASAQAQTWRLQFTPSTSQGTSSLTGYDYILTPQGAPALPAQSLGLPTPTNGTITTDVTSFFSSLSPGTYTGVVRALGPGGQVPSPVSDPFTITIPPPGAPGKPTFIKAGGASIGVGELATAQLAYDHDGSAQSYEIARDGVVVSTSPTPMTLPLIGTAAGVYTFEVTAVYGVVRYTSEPFVLTVL